MNDDIEQIEQRFPNHPRTWGKVRPRVTYVLDDDIKSQAVDTAAKLLDQDHGQRLGYRINRNHIINEMIATHPLTRDIEQELRNKGVQDDSTGRRED